MAPSEKKRWSLVLDVSNGPAQTFVVRDARDANEVMTAVRSEIRNMMARGGCRSMTIGIHVEGPECDHEVGVR